MTFELNLAQRAGIFQWGIDILGKGNSLTEEGGREKNMADLRSMRSFCIQSYMSYIFTCLFLTSDKTATAQLHKTPNDSILSINIFNPVNCGKLPKIYKFSSAVILLKLKSDHKWWQCENWNMKCKMERSNFSLPSLSKHSISCFGISISL